MISATGGTVTPPQWPSARLWWKSDDTGRGGGRGYLSVRFRCAVSPVVVLAFVDLLFIMFGVFGVL